MLYLISHNGTAVQGKRYGLFDLILMDHVPLVLHSRIIVLGNVPFVLRRRAMDHVLFVLELRTIDHVHLV